MSLLKKEHINLEHITKPIYVFLYGFSLSLILTVCESSATYDPNIKHKLRKEIMDQDSLIVLAENNLLSQLKTKTKQTIINDSCISYDWKIDEYNSHYNFLTKTIRFDSIGEMSVKIKYDVKNDNFSIITNDGHRSTCFEKINSEGEQLYFRNGKLDSNFTKQNYFEIITACAKGAGRSWILQ